MVTDQEQDELGDQEQVPPQSGSANDDTGELPVDPATGVTSWEWVAPVATAGASTAAVVATYLAARKTVDTQAQTAGETRDHERQMAELARARDREHRDREQRPAAYADCLTVIRSAGTTWQQLTNDTRIEIRTALVRVELLGTSTVARKADVVLDLGSHEDITSPVSLAWIEEQLLDAMREGVAGQASCGPRSASSSTGVAPGRCLPSVPGWLRLPG